MYILLNAADMLLCLLQVYVDRPVDIVVITKM